MNCARYRTQASVIVCIFINPISLLYISSLGQQGIGIANKDLAIKDDRKGIDTHRE